ncbi:response regulator transcription factor [Saccharopolyspora sp. K220]|uniref:winged helix-turn-helix domain-containing protein n=1 Tax=Saccharopolyspora soli TaxID=2926618 RepID=UPI001F564A98|nr:response regulator transcription factor [Saccharopolyspora soli]MCI2417955.1 response regulator transcription factor [Saccharopolyspora soli]
MPFPQDEHNSCWRQYSRETAGDLAPMKPRARFRPKPFDPEELIARIRAVLRRTAGSAQPRTMRVADLELDVDGHQALRSGEPVRLSPTEFRLLRYLMLNAGRVVSKRQILEQVWQYDFGGDPSIVDTYISYLRRELDTTEPKLIHTVHGVGADFARNRFVHHGSEDQDLRVL